ncbi:MAG: HD domain-containing phosphohydrolase [Pirellulales bacterium]
MMAYQHHERLDGEGYPVGIDNDEIEVASRICSIADVFEALTSHRPYRNAMSFASALAILNSGVDKAFDREILRCWQMVVRQHS